tara:strand:- start:241 stop:600 length:360 start_codon:yes stop_codon:yes gene_type:complete
MEEAKGGGASVLFIIIFAGVVAALLHFAKQGTDNLLHNPAKPSERKSVAPVFNDEMERRVIKAELGRPTGIDPVWRPVRVIYVDKATLENPCLVGDCGGEVSPTYRSSLDSIIIKEVLQ